MTEDAVRIEPGTHAKVSGQYAAFDDDGNDLNYEATVTRGEPLPPIPGRGFWLLADESKHHERGAS